MFSIIGILGGIAFFVYAAYKRVNTVLISIAASVIMALFSGMQVYEILTGPYMEGFAQFLNKYFLMILSSAVLGRLMSDSGSAKKIALVFSRLVVHGGARSKKYYSVLFVAVLYYLLSYVGITGYVLVFTVMPIARFLFETTDTPWRFYCFGGPQIAASAMLMGSLNTGNIFAMDFCGTGTTAGALLSVIAAVIWWSCTLVLIYLFLNSAEKQHETFLTDGFAVCEENRSGGNSEEEGLPSLTMSLLPLVLVVVCTAFFDMSVVKALVIGCLAAAVAFKKPKSRLFTGLSTGAADSFGPALTVAALYGFGAVVKILPAFGTFSQVLGALPGLAGGSALSIAVSFVIAGSAIPVFGLEMLEAYQSAGLSMEMAHRMMTICGWSSIAPHNAGLSNSASVTKIDYGRCMKVYLTAAYIPGIMVTIVCLMLISSGIIV